MLRLKPPRQLLMQPSREHPWSVTTAIGRSLVAACTLVSLLVHSPSELFLLRGVPRTAAMPEEALARLSLFSVSEPWLSVVHWISVVVLILVIVGWRPRITAIPHWYIAVSFAVSCHMVDGGDQIAANLALLLLPVCLLDSRKWQWMQAPSPSTTASTEVRTIAANATFVLIQLQVCVVYLHSATGKLRVDDWVNGTAVYYWLGHPLFGLPDNLFPIARTVLFSSAAVVGATWGTIILELALAASIFLPWGWGRMLLFLTGLVFHFSIVVVHGLGSFFFAMAGALTLYMLPHSKFEPAHTRIALEPIQASSANPDIADSSKGSATMPSAVVPND